MLSQSLIGLQGSAQGKQAPALSAFIVQGGSEWWQSHVGKDLSADFPTKPRPESMPDSAKQGRPNPRKDFEENVLKNVSSQTVSQASTVLLFTAHYVMSCSRQPLKCEYLFQR